MEKVALSIYLPTRKVPLSFQEINMLRENQARKCGCYLLDQIDLSQYKDRCEQYPLDVHKIELGN